MKLFLGVDGGQSSTVALIADETGRILGAGRGGPCNHVAASEGRAKFGQALTECLGQACVQAGLAADTVTFEAACLGFSGGVADKEAYSREFIRSAAFKITHDAEIALTGATAGKPGIIVIAGTGSIAFGRNEEGKTARAGGWGYIFGDEGGAFDIARQALRAALAMEEGWGEQTALRARLMAETNSTSANHLMHDWYNNFDRKDIARLAPVIHEVAEAGDREAIRVLARAARKLAGLVERIYQQLFTPESETVISYVGGVFGSHLVADAFRYQVHALCHRWAVAPAFPPAVGAVLDALRMAGVQATVSEIPVIKG